MTETKTNRTIMGGCLSSPPHQNPALDDLLSDLSCTQGRECGDACNESDDRLSIISSHQ
jgi:hypothetical protein